MFCSVDERGNMEVVQNSVLATQLLYKTKIAPKEIENSAWHTAGTQ